MALRRATYDAIQLRQEKEHLNITTDTMPSAVFPRIRSEEVGGTNASLAFTQCDKGVARYNMNYVGSAGLRRNV